MENKRFQAGKRAKEAEQQHKGCSPLQYHWRQRSSGSYERTDRNRTAKEGRELLPSTAHLLNRTHTNALAPHLHQMFSRQKYYVHCLQRQPCHCNARVETKGRVLEVAGATPMRRRWMVESAIRSSPWHRLPPHPARRHRCASQLFGKSRRF